MNKNNRIHVCHCIACTIGKELCNKLDAIIIICFKNGLIQKSNVINDITTWCSSVYLYRKILAEQTVWSILFYELYTFEINEVVKQSSKRNRCYYIKFQLGKPMKLWTVISILIICSSRVATYSLQNLNARK